MAVAICDSFAALRRNGELSGLLGVGREAPYASQSNRAPLTLATSSYGRLPAPPQQQQQQQRPETPAPSANAIHRLPVHAPFDTLIEFVARNRVRIFSPLSQALQDLLTRNCCECEERWVDRENMIRSCVYLYESRVRH